MKFIYNLGISFYFLILKILALGGHLKAKKFVEGRKFQKTKFEECPENGFWFHIASMGEYEQAKPIISKIKKISSKNKIVVSFFSPSGYENVKDKNIDFKFLFCPKTPKKMLVF